MCVLLTIMALSIQMQWGTFEIVIMCVVNLSIQIFLAGVHWVIIPEITNDAQFGLIATVHYLTAVGLSGTLEYELQYFGPQGTMFYFAWCNLIAFMVCYLYV